MGILVAALVVPIGTQRLPAQALPPEPLYSVGLTLDHPDPQAYSFFGFGLNGAGDVNGDGVPDLVVAASYQDVGSQSDQGRAYVFSGADGNLLLTLDDPNPQVGGTFGQNFGELVAGVGDVNGDGTSDLLVGAQGQAVGGNAGQGQAFLFSGADGSLLRTIDNPTPQADAFFGFPVARAADLDGDGVSEFLVGAPGQTVGGTRFQGQAFVFSGADGDLLLTLDNPSSQDGFFGESVVQAGDVNSDGVPDLLVGARYQDVGVVGGQGEAFVFSGANGDLLLTLDSPNPQPFGNFGFPVGAAGDLDGDGVRDLLAGGYQQGVAGEAYAFSGADGSHLFTIENPSLQPNTFFGFYQLVDVGDVDADGVPDVLVGAEAADVNGNADQGQAYIFSGVDGSLLLTLDHPNPQASSVFGITAAAVGDMNADGITELLIGAACQTVAVVCQGQVYLFTSNPTPELLLDHLVEEVVDMNLQQGISNSLDSKLDAALDATEDLNQNNDVAAVNALNAFINSVSAQRGTRLTTEQADALIAAAQRILDLVGDSNEPLDSDGDGVPDDVDQCPSTAPGTVVDETGCAIVPDSDGDGVGDDVDVCPGTPDLSQYGTPYVQLDGGRAGCVSLPGIDLSGADLSGTDLRFANLSGTNLSFANLRSADLTEAHMLGANLTEADLTGADLFTANLSGAVLTGANLSNTDLSSSDLSYADLLYADLSYADLFGADLFSATLSRADLTFAVLSGVDLRLAFLDDADLSYADLSYADLTAAGLTGANLSFAQLSDANLSFAALFGAELSGAHLSYADLSYADLSYADLSGADLSGADLTNAELSFIFWSNTTCPDGSNTDTNGLGYCTRLDVTEWWQPNDVAPHSLRR